MNSLSEFLSSPLLDFIPSNSSSNNTERPDEIDILLETLSESNIQLLDRRVINDLDDNEHQQDQGSPPTITVFPPALPALLIPNTTANHTITYTNTVD